MANKEKIDYLLLDIKELEKQVAGMRDVEIYPVSFFSQTFDLTHKILKDLHALEAIQIEMLRKQMEEHAVLLQSIPKQTATPMPDAPSLEKAIEEIPVVKEQIIKVEEPVKETNNTADRPNLFLNDLLEKKNLSDFRKAFSLNDRFRFRRELFGGDENKMNKAISDLNDIHSYEDSIAYLNNELKWNIEDEAVTDFMKLLEKRFL
ncbi:hypothetical protein [Parabacteroides chinchillae]|uniref:Uncharacterized protein n=1 Tax=Parabacteroides chinchillae TaxID=871327 RepID=A0A8G2BWK3_9BACT|nr:hypothetical protein [Parabacteroides chinchillae]SEF90027.1 hypothetical protein SAMN05444001_10947 [Parabacteroides chinchillae]